MNNKEISHKKLTPKEIFYASIRKKTYVEIGISLIIFIFLLVFALLPTIDSLDNVNEKLTLFRDINVKVNNNIQVFRNLKRQLFVNLQDESKVMENFILDEKDLHLVYYNLFKRAKNSNVILESLKIDSMSSDKVVMDEFYKKPFYVISLNVSSGDINKIVNFIKLLEGYENMPIVSRISAVNINKKYQNNVGQDDTENSTNNEARINNSQTNQTNISVQNEYFAYIEIRILKINN